MFDFSPAKFKIIFNICLLVKFVQHMTNSLRIGLIKQTVTEIKEKCPTEKTT